MNSETALHCVCVYVDIHTDLSPPESSAPMLRVGVQCCTMQSSAASTSCLMKALLSPAFCSKALTVPSSSWSIAFCRWVYRSPSVHTATLDTPDRRFFTWIKLTLLLPHRKQEQLNLQQYSGKYYTIRLLSSLSFYNPRFYKEISCWTTSNDLLNERQADIMQAALQCVWVVVSQTTHERQTLDLLLPEEKESQLVAIFFTSLTNFKDVVPMTYDGCVYSQS